MTTQWAADLVVVAEILRGYSKRLNDLAERIRSKNPPSIPSQDYALRNLASQMSGLSSCLASSSAEKDLLTEVIFNGLNALIGHRISLSPPDEDSGVNLSKPPTFELGDGKGEG